ncbi:MAG: hypothetical protein FGM14_11505 [Flavobacteriales bacterium]|nr:hypothetical protein [Flavobacteriales bacterium]
MRIGLPLLLIFFTVASCSLNAEQERNLNKSIIKYLFSVNRELKLSIAAATHPLILRELKEDGDEKLKAYLEPKHHIWTDAIIGKTKMDGAIVHIELKVALISKETFEKAPNRIRLYAISEDNGANWYFVDYKIYESNYCKKFKRLIKK